MKGLWKRFRKSRLSTDESGQTATEYMLIIAVVVLGAVAAASLILPKFKEGSQHVADKVKDTMQKSTDASTSAINDSVGGGT